MATDQRVLQVPVEEEEEDEVELLPCDVQAATSHKKKTVTAMTLGSLAVVLLVGVVWFRTRCTHDYLNLQDTVEMDATGKFQALSDRLKGVTSKSVAEKVVHRALTTGSDKIVAKWEATKGQHAEAPTRKLPNSFIPNGDHDTKGTQQGTAQCIFNVMEAMTATIALGDDINGMARVCRPPRPADSEIACQVDSGLMVAYIGLIAAKLSLAASNCAETANIDAVCAAGVSGIVFALGQVAATASLAAPTCSPNPPALPTSKISELGDQTLNGQYTGRRLVIGEGAVGNGIQCGVDVSLVAEQIANMGLAINQAVNSGNCDKKNFDANIPPEAHGNGGLVQSLCTVDIGGAIAYFGEAITFIQLAILNCGDHLDINALCGASIAGIATGAAAVAPYGAAIHAACRRNHEAKVATGTDTASEIKAKLHPRRLDEGLEDMDYYEKLTHVTDKLRATVATMDKKDTSSEANLNKLVELAEPGVSGASMRGAWPHDICQ